MKKLLNALMILCLTVILSVSSAQVPVSLAATSKITTTPTGYISADDVDYQTYTVSGKQIIANWGARGENCIFLSTKAQKFYSGSNTFANFMTLAGGDSVSNAPSSKLYSALKSFMTSKHSYIISYSATKQYYKYTDCVSNQPSKVSSFYSGKMVDSDWDPNNNYNREHTWPNSKGLGGSDENDIMMLRPTSPTENGSRGNTAYGESSSYFDPGISVHGDCARIFLYVYVRWGNTGDKAWGTDGVMESLPILLKWMKEDPVDTWEMARNDSVQSIIGTRNVFIDYPELAWKLFGESIPANMTTPSGGSSSGSGGGSATDTPITHTHSYGAWTVVTPATNDTAGLEKRVCSGCGNEETREIPTLDSNHNFSAWITITSPTYDNAGLEQRTCKDCGETQTREIPSLSDGHSFSAWIVIKNPTNDMAGLEQRTCKDCGETQTRDIPALGGSSDENSSTVDVAPNGTEKGCNGSLNLPMVGILAIAYSVMLVTRKKHK